MKHGSLIVRNASFQGAGFDTKHGLSHAGQASPVGVIEVLTPDCLLSHPLSHNMETKAALDQVLVKRYKDVLLL